jgi:hypothetical protein
VDSAKHLSLSLRTLVVAVLLGLIGNALLRDEPWGVGFAVYVGVLLLGCAHLYRHRALPLSGEILWLAPPALLFAAAFAWRDAPALKALNGLSIALLVGLAVHRARNGRLASVSVLAMPFEALGRLIMFMVDGVLLAGLEGRWKVVGQGRDVTKLLAVGRGLLIATPLLLVFGTLFAQADAKFETMLSNAFSFDGASLWSNGVVTVLCAWFAGGLLYRLFLAIEPPPKPEVERTTGLGATEIVTVLGLLDLLFLAFVATQFGHFFNGAEALRDMSAPAYKEYARRGFFELVTAAALALPVLLGTHALLRSDEGRGERMYRPLALGLVALLYVVMASATHRMVLYVGTWGITQLRVYVFASLAWLAVLFLWFCLTVLRNRPERFAFGGLVALLFGIATLNVYNPDAVTARSFLAHRTTSRIEPDYVIGLSDDAVPSMVDALDRIPDEARWKLEEDLRNRRERLNTEDWRSWDVGSHDARGALAGTELSRYQPPLLPPAPVDSPATKSFPGMDRAVVGAPEGNLKPR